MVTYVLKTEMYGLIMVLQPLTRLLPPNILEANQILQQLVHFALISQAQVAKINASVPKRQQMSALEQAKSQLLQLCAMINSLIMALPLPI